MKKTSVVAKAMLLMIGIIGVGLAIGYYGSRPPRGVYEVIYISPPKTNAPQAEDLGIQTAVVGANPTAAGQMQSFAPPSKDTNEVAKVAAERSAKAKVVLQAFQEAVRLNQVQEIKPNGPIVAQ